MKKQSISLLVAITGVLALTLSAAACQFSFNYSEITAPLGTVGELGVRVLKDHNNCTLPSMDDYQFAWENIQVLGETDWDEIGANLYEKWFQVSLSEIGNGYLRISKDCTKSGYEEASLSITALEPTDDGLWQQANVGVYPLEILEGVTVESVVGDGIVIDGTLTIDQLAIQLLALPATFDGDLGMVQLFFTRTTEGAITPLLIAADGFFLRFDHLAADGA